MHTTHLNLVRDVLLKGTVTIFAMAATALLGTSGVVAQVVFDDGDTHVISDDTYEFERIEVRGGSTLIIQDGAVIAASLGPAFELAIQVFDTSKLLVQGGTFGGDRLGLPVPAPFLDNWFSGSLGAFEGAKIIVEGGTFGACAFRSGTTFVLDDATLLVSGGTFTDPGGTSSGGLPCQAGGGRIELEGDARANISGGVHASSINATGFSTLNVSGGRHGKDTGGGRGVVSANGSSTVRISGGDFGAGGPFSGVVGLRGASTAVISSGMFGGTGFRSGALLIGESARVNVSGGEFGGAGFLAASVDVSDSAFVKITGGQFDGTDISVSSGLTKIEGCGFSLPFGPVVGTSGDLVGVLASGEVIDVTYTRAESADAIINLVEEPCD